MVKWIYKWMHSGFIMAKFHGMPMISHEWYKKKKQNRSLIYPQEKKRKKISLYWAQFAFQCLRIICILNSFLFLTCKMDESHWKAKLTPQNALDRIPINNLVLALKSFTNDWPIIMAYHISLLCHSSILLRIILHIVISSQTSHTNSPIICLS